MEKKKNIKCIPEVIYKGKVLFSKVIIVDGEKVDDIRKYYQRHHNINISSDKAVCVEYAGTVISEDLQSLRNSHPGEYLWVDVKILYIDAQNCIAN